MKKKTKRILILAILLILLFPFRLAFSWEDETFVYRSLLLGIERTMDGTTEPHPVSDGVAVVSYDMNTTVKVLMIPVYHNTVNYEGWLNTK